MRFALPALTLALQLAITAPPAAAQRADPFTGFDAYVAGAVKDWKVPGLAIAVVSGDSVVLVRGFGVRTIGRPEPVTIHTLFANASTTKAFTSMAAAMLVDEGKLRWDDPISRYLPQFQLQDPLASRELTIRDVLSHRVGFPDPGYLWYGTPWGWDEIAKRVSRVQPASSFRSAYAYNNVTYAAGGVAAAAAAGMPWGDLVRSRILEPLGMRETFTGEKSLASQKDIASPHYKVSDTVTAITRLDFEQIAPAGTMYSTASDMAKWLRFLLDSTRVQHGAPLLVKPATFAELFTPQTVIRRDDFYPTARLTNPNFTAYGLGWFLLDYRGERVALHTGSIDGFVAIVGLMPSRRTGIVVFANLDHAELRHALVYSAFDRVLDAASDSRPSPKHDWSREFKVMYDSMSAAGEVRRKEAEKHRVTGTHPTLSLDKYAGTYADSLYGDMTVRVENGALTLSKSPLLTGTLEHWNYDTFRIRWNTRYLGTDLITFRLGTDGTVSAADLDGQLYARRK
jgi:CubicO group peptidase (beta-lactamase class C family)